MHVEKLLISKVSRDGTIEELLARGVEKRHFDDEDCAQLFETLSGHVRTYHSPPSFDLVREQHPDFSFELTDDSLVFLLDRFVADVKRRITIDGIRDIARETSSTDPATLLKLDESILELAQDIARAVPTTKVERLSEAPTRVMEYKKMAKEGFRKGAPLGLGKIDEYTLGIQPGEYWSIVGWQGKGKSTLLQRMLLEAWLDGKTILFFSLEMKARSIFRRFDVMHANIKRGMDELMEYNDMKALQLDEAQLARWEQDAKKLSEMQNDVLVIDDVLRCTPDRVLAEISRHKPDICAVDYITLMENTGGSKSSMWESITSLTRQMKMIAQSTDTALYAVAQTNINSAEAGAKLENIAFARSIGADSDIVIGMHQDDEMRQQLQMRVDLLKNRDGSPTNQMMFWDPGHMYFRPWVPSDMYAVKTESEVFEQED